MAAPLLGACEEHADEATLDRWLDEARAAEVAAQRAHESEDESAAWTLTVLGEIGRGSPLVLDHAAFASASAVTVGATPPLEGAAHASYRGVRLDALIGAAGGPLAGVEEVTLVASDGFRATVAWSDALRTPILLATHRDDERLRRESGGPLLAVFPLDEHPDLLTRYTESWWVYYVTHLLVGTPSPRLRVAERELDAAALAALPETELVASVGYRVGWPSEPTRLLGPSLAVLLDAAGASLPEGGRIRVRTLAQITQGDDRPTFVSASEVQSGRVIVARAHGPDARPIPARLGGPLVLAFADDLASQHPEHDWLTFVTELAVETSEPRP